MSRWDTVKGSLKRRGLWGTLRLIGDELLFDPLHGYDTAGFIPQDSLDAESANRDLGVQYQPAPWRVTADVLSRLPIALPTCGFVDYGSGKGRALLIAARCGVKRLTGVEFSQLLCEICRKNLDRYVERTGAELQVAIHHVDATQYPIDAADDVFFFYNPFAAEVLVQVLDRIEQSLREHPRPAVIVYVMPAHRELMAQRFRPLFEVGSEAAVYEAGAR